MDATYVVTKPNPKMTGLPTPNVKTSELPSSSVREIFPPRDGPLESYQVNSANLLMKSNKDFLGEKWIALFYGSYESLDSYNFFR